MAAISLILIVQKNLGLRFSQCQQKRNMKNGCHFVNIDHMEKFQITEPPKFGSLVFHVSTEMENHHWPLWKNWKMAAFSLISIIWKNFKLLTPPKFWVFSFPSVNGNRISPENWRYKFSFFSEFSIGSFFPITHPRLHLNIYAWLHLKNLCVDIYAWFTSHLWSTLSMDTSSHFFCKVTLFTDNTTLCTLYHLIR